MRHALVVMVFATGCHTVFGLETITEPPVTAGWATVAAGLSHTCAIRDSGELWCWGLNGAGQTGTGSPSVVVGHPAQVPGTWTAVASRFVHTCGIQTDASLWCWGANAYGALGIGSTSSNEVPLRVGSDAWSKIATGTSHTCGIKSDGSLWCWGYNEQHQVAVDSEVAQLVPVQVAPGSWLEVAAGRRHSCALDASGSLWCWGENIGQIFGDDEGDAITPRRVGDLVWKRIAVSGQHGCGILADGRLRCWGNNPDGEVGDDVGVNLPMTPVTIAGVDHPDWDELSVNEGHTCGRREGGRLYCWGRNHFAELGQPLVTAITSSPLAVTQVSTTWGSFAIGSRHLCAVDDTFAMWCIGADGLAELGDGGTSKTVPIKLAGTWKMPIAGRGTTCALDPSGTRACAGVNDLAQLGLGDTLPRATLTSQPGLVWSFIALGNNHGCGMRTDVPNLYCWGLNLNNEFGNGNPTLIHLLPEAAASGIESFTQLSASGHTCGVAAFGALHCWGANDKGQVGNGTTNPASAPNVLGGVFKGVAAGDKHTCAVLSDGQLACWGNNADGQIGNTGTTNTTVPGPAGGMGDLWQAIALGNDHSCGIREGSLAMYCWGANPTGALGVGDAVRRLFPTAVTTALTWNAIAAGSQHTCGIASDNTLWCWGKNDRGQLGDGTLVNRLLPVQIGADTDWEFLAADSSHTCATKADTTMWCWGSNDYGELGNGDSWKTVFIQVP